MSAQLPVAGLALLWLALAFVVLPVPSNIDEVIYLVAAEAMAERGSLVLENGYEHLGEPPALKLLLTVAGPGGLAPQYPSGYFVLAAPFLWAFGASGLIVLNALAAGAALILTHGLAVRLFGDRRLALVAALILGLGTFMTDFALGMWPHAVSGMMVLAVIRLAVEAVLGPPSRAPLHAALAGLVLGLGILIRVDVVLVGPPLAIWAILYAARPVAVGLAGAAGLVPGLAAAAALNLAKFGSANPLSYGQSGGGTDPANHLWLLPVLALGFAACILLRRAELRRWSGVLALGGLAAVAGAAALSPAVADGLAALGHGASVLLWDMRLSDDGRAGVVRLDDGTVYFFGAIKAALVQSLPWLGILGVLLVRRPADGEGRMLLLLVLVAAIWMLPFLARAWYGGWGSNMRYFLPVLPCLAILAALALRETGRLAGERGTTVRMAVALGLGWLGSVAVVAKLAGWNVEGALQYSAMQWLFVATAAAAVAAGLVRTAGGLAAMARGLCFAGLAASFVLVTLGDTIETRSLWAEKEEREATFSALPGDSLVFSFYPFLFQLRREGAYQARVITQSRAEPRIDGELVERALESGLRVFVEGDRLARLAVESVPWLSAELVLTTGARRVHELRRASAPAEGG